FANARCRRTRVPNHMNNSRVGKNFQPRRSEQRGARFFPAPSGTKSEPCPEPKRFGIAAITKDPAKIAADICPKIGNAIILSFRRLNPFQKWLGIVPGGVGSLQIILV